MQEKLVLLVDCRLLLFWRHNQLVDWVVRLGDDRKREGGRHRAFLLRLLRLGRRTPSRHRLAAHEYEAAILRAPADSSPLGRLRLDVALAPLQPDLCFILRTQYHLMRQSTMGRRVR